METLNTARIAYTDAIDPETIPDEVIRSESVRRATYARVAARRAAEQPTIKICRLFAVGDRMTAEQQTKQEWLTSRTEDGMGTADALAAWQKRNEDGPEDGPGWEGGWAWNH